ncbi:NAD(P)H-binding protein [Streptomyces sp. NPDC003077]|uniref:NAD(P)H-binding protein n=1 Tax=Streptomyces sp. NPDC003077 TaxID=3154443 RepID=UPI0033BA9629
MIVVTGATGNIGRDLVGRLVEQGAPVRALTRNPERAGLPAGVETIRADLTDPASLEPALQGADAVFLNHAAGGERGTDLLVEAAVRAGVRRIVFNSSLAVTDTPADDENFIARMHATAERVIRASGLEFTFIRGGMYASNTLEWAEAIRTAGTVRLPHPGATGAPVHETDLAELAALALLDRDGTHAGQTYVVTGPEGITMEEQVAEIGRVIGRPLTVEKITPEEAAEGMTLSGVPKELALTLIGYFGSTVGTKPQVTDTFERLTGRPPHSFAEWARDHAGDFR